MTPGPRFPQYRVNKTKQRTHSNSGEFSQGNWRPRFWSSSPRVNKTKQSTHFALCTCCVCFVKIWWRCINNFLDSGVYIARCTSIPIVSMSVLYLFSLKHDATTLLLCVHTVSVFLRIMMTMFQQFSRLTCRICVLFHIFFIKFCFVVGKPLFPATASFMGFPLTLTPLSVLSTNTQGSQGQIVPTSVSA